MSGLLARHSSMVSHVIFKAILGAILILAWLHFVGCCTYHGKAVSKADAERMKALGMDVQCQ